MTGEEFKTNMDLLVTQAGILALMDLEAMRRTVTQAEDFGCFVVAPAQYQRALPNLKHMKALIDAAIGMKTALQAAQEEFATREPRS